MYAKQNKQNKFITNKEKALRIIKLLLVITKLTRIVLSLVVASSLFFASFVGAKNINFIITELKTSKFYQINQINQIEKKDNLLRTKKNKKGNYQYLASYSASRLANYSANYATKKLSVSTYKIYFKRYKTLWQAQALLQINFSLTKALTKTFKKTLNERYAVKQKHNLSFANQTNRYFDDYFYSLNLANFKKIKV